MNLDHFDRLIADFETATTLPAACHALGPIFDAYEVTSFDLVRDIVYWRARFAETTPWPSVVDISYPRGPGVPLGRMSDATSPRLYASLDIDTALREIGAAEGTSVQVVGFRVLLGTYLRLAIIGEMLHVRKTGHMRFGATNSGPSEALRKHLASAGPEREQLLLYLDEFLAHQLADLDAAASGYFRSRAVASMVHRNNEIDGIVFPSLRDAFGMNVAVRPTAADGKMHAVCCFRARITRIRKYGRISYELTDEAENLDGTGNFLWASSCGMAEQRLFNMTQEEAEVATKHAGEPDAFAKVLSVYSRTPAAR